MNIDKIFTIIVRIVQIYCTIAFIYGMISIAVLLINGPYFFECVAVDYGHIMVTEHKLNGPGEGNWKHQEGTTIYYIEDCNAYCYDVGKSSMNSSAYFYLSHKPVLRGVFSRIAPVRAGNSTTAIYVDTIGIPFIAAIIFGIFTAVHWYVFKDRLSKQDNNIGE